MRQREILNLLDTFAARNRCFTLREVSDWAADPVASEQLRPAFGQDARFIRIGQGAREAEYFLPERELFRWWAGFNWRLVDLGQARLTEGQLTTALNSLRPEGAWSAPPGDILNYGRQFGLVAVAWTPGIYVFPLAYILAQTTPRLRPAFQAALTAFEEPKARDLALRQKAAEVVETVLAQCDPRNAYILKGREGLPPRQRIFTLAELGRELGRTRERVRQVERQFWHRLNNPAPKGPAPTYDGSALIPAFIAELMRRQGSLLLDPEDGDTPWARFLAKSAGVPYARAKAGPGIALGISDLQTPARQALAAAAPKADNPYLLANQLARGPLAYLGGSDLQRLADAIVDKRPPRRRTKSEKVYAVLQHLGQPAHFSEVAAVYNRLFPDDPTSEHNIHGILTNCGKPDSERYGIVWIGSGGTYALKENGYARPKLGLFDAVTKIVTEQYAATGQPVSVSVIAAELGKQRPIINPASFAYATSLNPRLEKVAKDHYIPKDLGSEG